MNLGGPEFILLVVLLILLGLAPYVTWRRGGSSSRIAVALLVSLIPYGFILGLIIALTTKQTSKFADSAMRSESAAASVGALAATSAGHGGPDRSSLFAIVLVVALGSALTGLIGYYAGRQGQVLLPTWTDREIRATGTQNVGTLRCTYHMADGSVRVRESVITLSTTPAYDPFARNASGDRTPDCPALP